MRTAVVPREVLVKLASPDDASELALRRVGASGTLLHRRSPRLEKLFARHRVSAAENVFPATAPPDLRRVFKLSIDRDDPAAAIADLKATPGVVYAEPNRIHSLMLAPTDPYYQSSGSWGQSYRDLWGLAKTDVATAWTHSTGSNVVVAVIDSGIDYNHPDIAANVWQNPGEVGFDAQGVDRRLNGIDDDQNGFIDDWRGYNFARPGPQQALNDPIDDIGHGTHVAGTIAAVADNGVGVVGVAPAAKLMAIKAFSPNGTATDSDLASAIAYAAQNGAAVINASWGVFSSTPDRILIDAVNDAHDRYGVVFVAAAGNSAVDMGHEAVPGDAFYPAAAVNAIAVAATSHLDSLAPFSDWGAKLDVAAPGGGDGPDGAADIDRPDLSILSLLSSRAGTTLTGRGRWVVGTQYLRQAGTSMATAYVGGVAALIRAVRPGLTPEEVRQAIRAGADDIFDAGWDARSGYGRLNAGRAVAIESPLSAQLTGPLAPPSGVEHLTITGSAAGANFARYRVEYGAGPTPASWAEITSSGTPVVSGPLATWNLRTVANGAYTVRLTAQSTSGTTFEDRLPLVVQNVVIESPSPEENVSVRPGQTIEITGFAAAPDFASFDVTIEGLVTGSVPASAITVINGGAVPVEHGTLALWDTAGLATDHYTLTLSVSSGDGTRRVAHGSVIIDTALHEGWPWRPGDPGVAAQGSGDTWFGPTVVDLDGDGASEVLSMQGPNVHALRHDGSPHPGWPQTVGQHQGVSFSPLAGDITGDGAPEVIASSGQGAVFVWAQDGTILLGWPKSVGTTHQTLALADLDRNGSRDIVAVTWDEAGEQLNATITVVDRDANVLPGWPRVVDRSLGKPTVGDVDGDGSPEIVVASRDGAAVYVLGSDGQTRPGWPKTLSATPLAPPLAHHSIPALADLDGDGKADIIVGSSDGQLMAWRGDGVAVAGWPRSTAAARVNSPAVGDLDGDGRIEVVAGIHPVNEGGAIVNYLYAWRADGTSIPGWPIRHAPGIINSAFGFGAPALADVDGDGRADIIVTSDGGARAYALHAFRANGTEVVGFPRPTAGGGTSPTTAPAIGDLDGDGLLETVWSSAYRSQVHGRLLSQLIMLDLTSPRGGPLPWPTFAHDAGKTGFLAPAPPPQPPAPPPIVALPRTGWRATGSNATSTASAFDGDAATRWATGAPQRSGQYYQLDLGSLQTFSRVSIDSRGTAGNYPRAYQIFVSKDGAEWGSPVAVGQGTTDLIIVDFVPQTARHLRIVQTGSASNWWSIYEINVYGPPPPAAPMPLSPAGWIATASSRSSAAAKALDGLPSTRWTTGIAQARGQWFQVDMLSARSVAQLTVNSDGSAQDFPRGYQLFVSNDAVNWGLPVASGVGTGSPVTIAFSSKSARYLRLVQSGTATSWWSIHELQVYETAPPPPPPPPVALGRQGWTASASRNAGSAGAAMDGRLATRWTTGVPQASGQYFQLDMGGLRLVSGLTLNAAASNDYPRGYQVFVSGDGTHWGAAIASGTGSAPLTTVTFLPQTARYLRVTLTGTTSPSWWSIHELTVWR